MTDPTPKPQHLPGAEFQNLVSMLERIFASEEGATVESPKRLKDKDTGRLREHDIVLTRVTHHGPTLTALECKDKSRPVGVPDVEAFFAKLERTGVNHGYLVSAKGFTDTARAKADAMNIGCMTLAQAEKFDWVGDAVFVQSFRQFTKIDFHLICENELKEPWTAVWNENGLTLETSHGQDILNSTLTEEAYEAATAKGEISDTLTLEDPPLSIIDADGVRQPVKALQIMWTLAVTETRPPFTLHTYTSDHSEYQVATSEMTIPGYDHKIMMVRGEDGIKVSLVPNNPKTP